MYIYTHLSMFIFLIVIYMKQQIPRHHTARWPTNLCVFPFEKVTRASCLLLPAVELRKPRENRESAGGRLLAKEKKASQTELELMGSIYPPWN